MTRRQRQAQVARTVIEAAFDLIHWRWSRRLSFWLDRLLIVEEESQA
jgi:hypothetical protein